MHKRDLVATLILTMIVSVCPVWAADFSVDARPELTIPLGTDSNLYSLGGGGAAHARLSLFNLFAPGLQTGVQIQPLRNTGSSLVLVRGGVEANFSW